MGDFIEQSVFKHHMRELRSPFADYKARRKLFNFKYCLLLQYRF